MMMLMQLLCIFQADESVGADWRKLAIIPFGIGILALLILIRRTVISRRRRKREETMRVSADTARLAKAQIDQISCRDQYESYRDAEKVQRHQEKQQ